jgi:aryl-alcohol dehydrogenase-like predicted oxidoreductase
MTDVIWDKRRLGRAGFYVTPLGLGGAWLGRNPHGGSDQDVAVETVLRALELGINLIDTSGTYLGGKSEEYIGIALEEWYKRGGKREDLILSTKTGTRTRPKDYTAQGTRQSIEKSLEMLKTDYLDIVLIHDPDNLKPVLAPGCAWDVLKEYKRKGVIRAIGLGVHNQAFHRRMIKTGECDVCLTHSEYNLLTQSAASGVLRHASANDVGIFNGSSLAMGLLSGENPKNVVRRFQERRHRYQQRNTESRTFKQKLHHMSRMMRFARYRKRMKDRVSRAQILWDWAQVSGINLLALNLQYCLRDPRISAVLMGASTPDQIEADVAALNEEISASLWEELPKMGSPLPGIA